jgi:chaperonin GroEL (HSP60 family)
MTHDMPAEVKDAKIALINVDISLPEFAQQLQIQVANNDAVQEFIESRKGQLQEIAETVLASGANVVLCKRDIDPFVAEIFAEKGIYAARRVATSDMEAIAKSCDGRIVSSIDGIKPGDLATSDLLEEINVGEKAIIKLTGTPNAGCVSVLLRAPTHTTVEEIGRAFDDAVGVVSVALDGGKVLAGGGAPYLYLSKHLRDFASTVSGREQMAVEAFAQALEIIPASLAENSGLDPLDTLIKLRQLHSTAAGHSYGVDVENGGGVNMVKQGVVEPLNVVSQALDSATTIAAQLLRIDNIIEMNSGPEIGEDGFQY